MNSPIKVWVLLVHVLVAGFVTVQLLLNVGCGSSLRPFREVRASLPADQFVNLENQWVHFERVGSGPTLVLIHGFGGSTFSWREVQPALAADFDVVAIDLSGFGYTERPKSDASYTVEAQAGLVLRLLDALGVPEADVAGHSYGAGLALHLAQTHPDRVRTLILVDGGPNEGVPANVATIPAFLRPLFACLLERFFLTPDAIRGFLVSYLHRDEIVTDAVVEGYLARLRVEGLADTLNGLFESMNRRRPAIDLAVIGQPTLVIWGTHDSVFPISAGRRLAERIPGAAFVEFESSGHLPMEEEPERFVEVVRDFLAANRAD